MNLFLWGDIIKSLFKAVAVLSFFSILSRCLSFVFRVILSRQVTTVELGIYSVAISICSIFVTLLTAGIPLTISRKTAEYTVDKNKNATNKTVSAGITIALFLSVFVITFVLCFKGFFKLVFADMQSYTVILTLIPFMVFSAIYAPIRGYMWGKEQYTKVSIVELIEQILKLVLCLVLFSLGFSNNNLPAGLAISLACILSSVVGIVFFIKDGGRFVSPQGFVLPTVKTIAPLMAVRVAGSLLQPLISIVLPLMLVSAGFSSTQALSQLGIVLGMTFPLITIPTTLVGSLAMALVPKLSIMQKENQMHKLQTQVYNSLSFTLFCCFMFLPVFSALGEPICLILFKNTEAGVYLSLFAWLVLPMGISQITSSILNSLGHEKFVFFSNAISAIFIVLSIFILPKYVGIYSILIGMGLQTGIVSVINLIKIKKLIGYPSQISLYVKYLIISVLLFLFNHWAIAPLSFVWGNFIALIICGLLSVIYFVVLSYCFNLVNLEILTCKFKKNDKKQNT